MARNKIGFFGIHQQQSLHALKELWRRPLGNTLTILVIALSLTLPCTLYLVAKNLVHVSGQWENPSQITLYLNKGVSETQALELEGQIQSLSSVSTVKYVSPMEGLEAMRHQSGFAEAIGLLNNNPLPGVLVVEPVKAWQSAAQIEVLAGQLRNQGGVQEVRVDRDWIARLAAIKNVAVTLAQVIAIVMLVGVFLIVGNTLRLQVMNEKEEIQVMKLVGATNTYIIRPYLYTGVWYGLLGGILALFVTDGIVWVLNRSVTELAMLYHSPFHLSVMGWQDSIILLLITAFLGLLAARLSVGKHLRDIDPV